MTSARFNPFRRHFAFAAAALAFALTIPVQAQQAKNITLITPYQQSVTTNEMLNTLSELAGKKGWKANVIDTKGDFGQMASRMEDAIAAKTDAIVIVSADPNQVKTQIAAGLPKVFLCLVATQALSQAW